MRGSTSLPFHRHEDEFANLLAAGGDVFRFTASGTLLIGDAVYVSAANTVAKSATPANMQKFVGIVVGGGSVAEGQMGSVAADVGVTAATTGQDVFVQVTGKAWAIADAAITAGALLTQGATTAGRIDDSASATQGQIIGIALQAATLAADKVLILINHM